MDDPRKPMLTSDNSKARSNPTAPVDVKIIVKFFPDIFVTKQIPVTFVMKISREKFDGDFDVDGHMESMATNANRNLLAWSINRRARASGKVGE